MELDGEDATWEPISFILEDAPVIMNKKLKRIRLSTVERRKKIGDSRVLQCEFSPEYFCEWVYIMSLEERS